MDKKTYDYLVQLSLNCIQQRKQNTNSKFNDLIQLLIQTDLSDEEIVGQVSFILEFFTKIKNIILIKFFSFIAQCIAFFLGGFESISQTCAFAIYELALQPDIQNKLYDEISTLFPGDSLEIDYDKISSAPYLEAVIKETMRRHLVISRLFRKAMNDCEIGGIKLKKGKNF